MASCSALLAVGILALVLVSSSQAAAVTMDAHELAGVARTSIQEFVARNLLEVQKPNKPASVKGADTANKAFARLPKRMLAEVQKPNKPASVKGTDTVNKAWARLPKL